ncbi:MAG: PKD domain-containing protein [Planctomycetota bacterium]
MSSRVALCLLSLAIWAAPVSGQIVVNEVFYDGPGGDTGMFTELFGAPGTDLTGYDIVGINGAGGVVYATIDLAGQVIPADGYFVVAQDATVASADLIVALADWQNGPDQVALRLNGVIVDSLCYGTSVDLVCEGAPAADVVGSSLGRDGLSTDTNDNSVDFTAFATPTPGEINVPVPVCGAPTGLVCTSDCMTNDLLLQWTNGEAYPLGLEILRDGIVIAMLVDGTTTYTDTGLAPGSYIFTVRGTCANGLTATIDCAVAHCLVAPEVLINEIRIDEPGTDVNEYFELVGAPGTALFGLTYIVLGDGTGGSGVIEEVTPLSGFTIGASGTFVVAESTFALGIADLTTDLNFEASDNFTHMLVFGFTGADGADLDTNDDGVLDVTPWSEIVDVIALIEEENPPTATEFHYGPPTVGPEGTFVPGHAKRCPDAVGPFIIGLFDPTIGSDTPGASNSCCDPVLIGSLTSDASQGNAPFTVTLSATANGTAPFTWAWDSGDGQASTQPDTVTFTYTMPGTYDVTLVVTNDCGSDMALVTVVVCAPLVVDFSASQTLGVALTCVDFTDLTTGDVASYSWDLDGDSIEDSSVANPSFQYPIGDFDVTLTVTGSCGRVQSLTAPALVRSLEVGDCNADGTVDTSDAIFLASWLFAGGSPPVCVAACDANADSNRDLADVVSLLLYLFGGGPSPVAPPACTPCF